MRGSRFTQQQIVGILPEHEAGAATPALCRHHGISEQTFYRWKQKYGGLEYSEATRLRLLERVAKPRQGGIIPGYECLIACPR